jgi:hypothetical protein
MQMKQLSDFPEFVECRDAVQRAQGELQRISERKAEIQTALMSIKQKQQAGDEWDVYKVGTIVSEVGCCTNETELREEYADIEERERFVSKALERGRQELDRYHGAACREICEGLRPLFIEQIREILEAVKRICSANEQLERLRRDLEATGVRTDSLVSCVFDIGGPWDDPHGYGSRPSFYRKFVSEHFPELEPTKALRQKLTEKLQGFEKNGRTS